jgi:hypothetical protein
MDPKAIGDLAREHSAGKKRRLFAIVSRPDSAASGPKETRRVLVFDNHPDTLRLLFEGDARGELELDPPQSRHALHLALAGLLVLVLVAAMFWPLITR